MVTYVFSESCLVKVWLALDFAGVVWGTLWVLVDFEGTFSTLWHVSAQEGSSVLLELGTLRLNFKLIVAVEGCGISLIQAWLLIDLRSCLRLCCGLDLDATLRFISTKEDSLVGHEGRASRSYFGLLAEEPGLVSTVTFSFHIGRNDAVLHILELSTDSVFSIDWSCSTTSIKELARSSVVLTCCVRHIILEELLLGMLESWVIAYLLGYILKRILYATIGPTRLLKLAVLELFNFFIILTSIELGVGIHISFLLMLRHVF